MSPPPALSANDSLRKLLSAQIALTTNHPSSRGLLQVHEMLEFASTTNDKRVDLDAFSKIMAETKQV